MNYEDVFYENETKYMQANEEKLKKFILLFLKESKIDFYWDIDDDIYSDFISLQDYVYKYYPDKVALFYELLKASGFNMWHCIIDTMTELGYYTNKKITNSIKEKTMLAPYVKDLAYEDNEIVLKTDLNEYKFKSVWDYYRNDYEAFSYIKRHKLSLSGRCHEHSWVFMNYLNEKVNLVTELCPYLYEGNYYHSVLRDEKGNIVDLANGIVYSEDIRKDLFKGDIVLEISKENRVEALDKAVSAALDDDVFNKFTEPLILALNKQSRK